jgi:N-acetylglutamate synthase-like GNAT family acetyltransferase
MEVRPARTEDASRVAELLGQLGYPTLPEAAEHRLRALAASDDDEVWVAEREGIVVGLVGIHISGALEHDGEVAKVSAIVIDEAARRKGIGNELMAVAERRARRRDCVLMFLTTAERREDAHAFYRSIGFEETGRRFAKRLD